MMRFNKLLKNVSKFLLIFLIIFSVATILKDLNNIKLNFNKRLRRNVQLNIADETKKEELKELTKNFRQISQASQKLNSFSIYCKEIPDNLIGPISVKKPGDNFDAKSNDSILINSNYVQIKGKWQPIDCKARHRVAIIIPYKDRLNNLNYFLNHMHPFLQKQLLEYQIFIVEQSNDQLFNKGILMNAGFLEIMSLESKKANLETVNFNNTKSFPFDCVIFHDVDLLPQDDRIMYSCPSNKPRHLSVAIDKFKYKLVYYKLIGGVLNFMLKHLVQVNGYSNEYWGWGAEDDDMEARLSGEKIGFERPHIKLARYTMIKHKSRFKNPKRKALLKQARKRYQIDGLNNVEYVLNNFIDYKYYSHLYVDVGDPPAYILKLLNPNIDLNTTSIATNINQNINLN